MKVLFIIGRFHPNLVQWIAAFRGEGWDVEVVVGGESVNRVEHFSPRVIPPESIDRRHARKLAAAIAPDLVIIRSKDPRQRWITREAKRLGARAIYYDQRPYLRPRGWRAFRWDLKKTLQRIRRHHPLEGFTTTRGNGDVPRMWRHWIRVPMPVDDRIGERSYFIDNTPTVLLVGRLANRKKRHLWVLRALESSGRPWRLIVAGAGDDSHTAPGKRSREYYDELHRTLNAEENSGRIQLLEDLPHEQMARLYRQADIFVLPSTQELLGISVIEAMSHGCAVITSTGVGASGYLTPGQDGLVFDGDSYEAFRSQLGALLGNPERVRQLGQEAARTIGEKHRPADFVDHIRRIARL